MSAVEYTVCNCICGATLPVEGAEDCALIDCPIDCETGMPAEDTTFCSKCGQDYNLDERQRDVYAKLALAAEYEAGTEELLRELTGVLTECLDMSDNWPSVAYSYDLMERAKAALYKATGK
jgi:hypothetical protein